MGDYQHSVEVRAPAGQLFGYLSDVRNLPHYFTAMTSADPGGGQSVHVTATLHGTTREGEAWFTVDQQRQHLEWGSEGPSDYRGQLDVTGDATTSSVTVSLHTERHDSPEIDQGITDTLAAVKRLVEAGPAPGPTSGPRAGTTDSNQTSQ
ncbi:MAG TPA: SRPBCC family protein [Streptosporangiaceae bacterium]